MSWWSGTIDIILTKNNHQMLHHSAVDEIVPVIYVKVVIACVSKLNMFEAREMVEIARCERGMELNLKCKNKRIAIASKNYNIALKGDESDDIVKFKMMYFTSLST
jgi:F0F1-type ATP synthase alpha subunit